MRGLIITVTLGVLLLAGCMQRVCGNEVNFVCGSDGVTYQNPCLAQDAGTKIASAGICQSNATAAEELCSDSDSGKNLLEKGTAWETGQNQTADSCINADSVQEGFCESGHMMAETMQCPQGMACEDGLCTPDICNDSDGGTVPGAAGTVRKGAAGYIDACSDGKHVMEQYCSGNKPLNITIECGSMEGCSEGACARQSVCFDSDGGDDAGEKGTATTDDGGFTDSCRDESTLREYWCDGNALKYTDEACGGDYWCAGGECVYQNCLDSDAGKDKDIGGQVEKSGNISKDGCADSDTVLEYYCEANDVSSVEMDCGSDEACVSGRCIEAGCIDSDGGNEPLISGTASIGTVSKMDECLDTTTLKEYRCAGGDYTYADVDCFAYFAPDAGICWNRVCAKTSCTDSDGGKNTGASGSATMTTISGYSEYRNDGCVNATAVMEYSCDGNWLVYEEIPCGLEQFCFMSQCVDSPCLDSDGGADYSVAGAVSKGLRYEEDNCLDNSTLREWTCSGGSVASEDHPCLLGCDIAGRACSTP